MVNSDSPSRAAARVELTAIQRRHRIQRRYGEVPSQTQSLTQIEEVMQLQQQNQTDSASGSTVGDMSTDTGLLPGVQLGTPLQSSTPNEYLSVPLVSRDPMPALRRRGRPPKPRNPVGRSPRDRPASMNICWT